MTIAAHFTLPLSLAFTPAATAAKPEPLPSGTLSNAMPMEEGVAGKMHTAGSLLAADNTASAAAGMARSYAVGKAGQTFQQWLDQFGSARLQLNTDRNFRLDGSALDMLLPLYETEGYTAFTQWGIRNKDHRNTANIGIGIRRFLDDRMYGVNTFFDNDLTGHNRRMGVGAETRTDFLKLSVNGYFALTGWHESRDLVDYDERPANGYDIRAEAWLPSHPQLGLRAMYEQYRGNDVALFGNGRRQKDPYAVTAGLNYTPIPLLTLGADHRAGKGGNSDTGLHLQVNYRLGTPWLLQVDPAAVASQRTLAASRHDLVDRNNQIVLAYRKQQVVRLDLPEELNGRAGEILPVTARVTTKYGLGRIEWRSDALVAAGGGIDITAGEQVAVTLPAYRYPHSGDNVYTLSGIAYDSKGNPSNQATTTLRVAESLVPSFDELEVSNNFAVADGRSVIRVSARLIDGQGRPLAGRRVTFTADNGATVVSPSADTGKDGRAMTEVLHERAGVTRIRAETENGYRETDITFVEEGQAILTGENLKITRDNAVADGQDYNEVEALITDNEGKALSGQVVTFMPGEGNPAVTEVAGTTGDDGIARARLTNTLAGNSEISARVGEGQVIKTTARFIPGRAERILLEMESHPSTDSLNTEHAMLADGGESFYRLIMRTVDKHANPVPNVTLVYSGDESLRLPAKTGETDAQGSASLSVNSLNEGTHEFIAALGDGNGARAQQLSFSIVNAGFKNVINGSDKAEFALTEGFPQTGFLHANFFIYPGSTNDNLAQYTWASSNSAIVPVVAGLVNFNSHPSSPILIEARKPGYRFTYTIEVPQWFVMPRSQEQHNYLGAIAACASQNMRLPKQQSSAGELAGGQRGQAGGGLLAEWGPMNHYNFPVSLSYWADSNQMADNRLAVNLQNGAVKTEPFDASLFYVCVNEDQPMVDPHKQNP